MLSRRLSAPLSILAEGTQAVAAGRLQPAPGAAGARRAGRADPVLQPHDAPARGSARPGAEEPRRSRGRPRLPGERAGQPVGRRARLRRRRPAARGQPRRRHHPARRSGGLREDRLADWPRLAELREAVTSAPRRRRTACGSSSSIMPQDSGPPQTLLLRGSRLPQASGGGHVVVFDDITQLISAQRDGGLGRGGAAPRRTRSRIRSRRSSFPPSACSASSPTSCRRGDARDPRARHHHHREPGRGA
ncbi:MAG: hypothetical protein MZW92_76185 [Comamonadaceae bacterium]|nr:hypothetical protein [Comamonadaceae bacterium]